MRENLIIFGSHDDATITQLQTCMDAGDAAYGVLCADGHKGYSQPIGGAVAYPEHVSISGVGYDIGCGVRGVLTDLRADDIRDSMSSIMDEIARRISFGMGRNNDTPADHPVLDQIRTADFAPQRQLYDLAAKQLGTVGSGNHYTDILSDEQGRVWIMVHFGSRGFGHKTASGFLAMAQGLSFETKAKDGEMDSPPVLAHQETELAQAYWSGYQLASAYAYAGRQVVTGEILDILGARQIDEVETHHNFLERETHFGRDLWVVRKGCTPVFPGQRGMVGGSMGDISVVIEGKDTDMARQALYSTMHGAGRLMSRTQAAGKWKKVWQCGNRDCVREIEADQANSTPGKGSCDEHPNARPRKIRVRKGGKVDWAAWKAQLAQRGVHVRGGGADESPEVYRRLQDVVTAHADTTNVVHTLTPMGVCMAGDDVFDAYKD